MPSALTRGEPGCPRQYRKGDFQLSLGLIVTVVFAVVLLSLSVLWIQGFFGQLPKITDDLVQEAGSKIRETFRTSNENFAIWPNERTVKPDSSLKMLAGIKNDAADGKDHLFAINVIPIKSSICPDGSCLDSLRPWLTFDDQASIVLISSVGERRIELRVPASAVQGTYLFQVVACSDYLRSSGGTGAAPVSSACTGTSTNLYSNPRSLTITVAS